MLKEILIILIIFFLCSLLYQLIFDRTVYVTVGNEKYLVQYISSESDDDRYQTASMLAELIRRGDTLVEYMYRKNIPSFEVSERLRIRWKALRTKPWGIRETSVLESVVAYTAFKTLQLRTCLRDRNGNLEEINAAMFVLLHEMAHIMSVEYGHFEEFDENFAILTKVAIELGIYSYVDYQSNPIEYCNMEIHSTSI